MVRAVPEHFFGFYDRFLELLKNSFGIERLSAIPQRYPDGAAGLQYIHGDGTTKTLDGKSESAIVPYWLVQAGGHSYRDVYGALDETLDALLGGTRGELPIVKSVTIVAPYLGIRTDHPSHNNLGEELTGEALYARMLATTLGKYRDRVHLVTLGIHGSDFERYLGENNIGNINLSMAPQLAEFERQKIDDQTRIVALDKGTLQRCLLVCRHLGLDPYKFLVVFNKFRDEMGKLKTELVYPDKETLLNSGRKLKARLFDDVIDTSTSAKGNLLLLSNLGFQEAMILTESATLSYPARRILEELFREGFLTRVVTTNSLPNAPFYFENMPQITTLDCAPLMAAGTALAANFDLREVGRFPHLLRGTPFEALWPYILQPRDKESVWQAFKKRVADEGTKISSDNIMGGFGL